MKPLLRALTSNELPSPVPLRQAGYNRWDLDQALLQYENSLFEGMLLSGCIDDAAVHKYESMMARAQRNHDYLWQYLN